MKLSTIDAAKIIHELDRANWEGPTGEKDPGPWEEQTVEYRDDRALEIHRYLNTGDVVAIGNPTTFKTVVDALR